MSTENKQKDLSEEELDEIVIAQADNDAAWEEAVTVPSATPISLSLPPELARRAAFLAQLHRMSSVEEWLKNVIQQRVDFEESAFMELKQALDSHSGT